MMVGVEGETGREFERWGHASLWVKPGELGRAVSFFKKESIQEVLMLGKIRPDCLLDYDQFDGAARLVWEKTKTRSPAAVLRAVVDFFEQNGLGVMDPFPFLEPYFCQPGVLTSAEPSTSLLEDVDFGLGIARRLADLDIGQTVIVKDRLVVAIEGLEGTDRTILRGGELAGPGIVAVKAGRREQEMRLDVPGVGLETIRMLVRAGGSALGIEAHQVAFFDQKEAVALAEAHGITIAVRKVLDGGA